MRFLHKDEFEAEFGERYEYPVVLEQYQPTGQGQHLSVVVSSQILDELQDVGSLINHLASHDSTAPALHAGQVPFSTKSSEKP